MAKARDGSKKKQISDALLREITSGDLSEGDSLPSVRTLAERYETSLYTIQSALKVLEEDGYVRTKHGRGSFIADAAHGRTIGFSLSRDIVPIGNIAIRVFLSVRR